MPPSLPPSLTTHGSLGDQNRSTTSSINLCDSDVGCAKLMDPRHSAWKIPTPDTGHRKPETGNRGCKNQRSAPEGKIGGCLIVYQALHFGSHAVVVWSSSGDLTARRRISIQFPDPIGSMLPGTSLSFDLVYLLWKQKKRGPFTSISSCMDHWTCEGRSTS